MAAKNKKNQRQNEKTNTVSHGIIEKMLSSKDQIFTEEEVWHTRKYLKVPATTNIYQAGQEFKLKCKVGEYDVVKIDKNDIPKYDYDIRKWNYYIRYCNVQADGKTWCNIIGEYLFEDELTALLNKEEQNKEKPLVLEKLLVMRTNELNSNGRIYPKDVVAKAILDPIFQARLTNRTIYGTLGQTNDASIRIDPSKASHVLTNLAFEGNDVYADILVLDTDDGKKLRDIISNGKNIELAISGFGDFHLQFEDNKPINTIDSLKLTSVDVVDKSSTRQE